MFKAVRESRSAGRVKPSPLCKVVEKRARFHPGFIVEIIFDMETYLAHVLSDNNPIRL